MNLGMNKRAWSMLLLLVVAALVLAACGGDKDENVGAEAAAAATVNAETNVDTAAEVAEAAVQGDPAKGEATYKQICIACHGEGGAGVQGLGKPLTTSDFVKGLADGDLHDFIMRGRDVSDPANTTGVAMPPKGGNPALSDDDIYNVIAYIRQIQAQNQ